jgi:hypothetical protein
MLDPCIGFWMFGEARTWASLLNKICICGARTTLPPKPAYGGTDDRREILHRMEHLFS